MRKLELKSGVVLDVRAVPSMVIAAVQTNNPEPKPPTWINEEKGNREESNPADPTYLKAVEEHKTALAMKINDAFLANGVKVVSLPEDKVPLDSDEWIEGLTFVGLDVPKTGIGRRVAWLRWHILDDSDFVDVISAIASAGGLVTEAQVEEAAKSFRPNENGLALVEVSTAETS